MEILTVKDVAKLLNVSVWTVYRWVETGGLSVSVIRTPSGRIRFERKELIHEVKESSKFWLEKK